MLGHNLISLETLHVPHHRVDTKACVVSRHKSVLFEFHCMILHFHLVTYEILKHLSSFPTEMNVHTTLGASCRYNSPYGNYGLTTFSSQSYTTRPYATPSPFTRYTYAPTQHAFAPTEQTYTSTRHPFSTIGFRQHYYG